MLHFLLSIVCLATVQKLRPIRLSLYTKEKSKCLENGPISRNEKFKVRIQVSLEKIICQV